MNNEDEKNIGYTIAIIILSTISIIMFMIIIIGIRVINDLNGVIDMHKNTIGVCNVDLKHVQKENEELRNKCFEK